MTQYLGDNSIFAVTPGLWFWGLMVYTKRTNSCCLNSYTAYMYNVSCLVCWGESMVVPMWYWILSLGSRVLCSY